MTGGGTAGHVMPLLALLPLLGRRYEVHYVGRKEGIERELAEAEDVVYHGADCPKLVRGKPLSALKVPFSLIQARKKARKLVKEISPSLIISKGGYVSLPTALECGDVPLLVHESDASFGLANRLAAKKASVICSSFPLPSVRGKTPICTGSPLRRSIYSGDAEAARRACGFSGKKKTLLVLGGSTGAKAVNDAVDAQLGKLTRAFDVVHIRGRGNGAKRLPGYFPLEFTPAPQDFFALADLAVTRGGGNSLFELGALGIPMLIVPLPKGASRGDQEKNAEYFSAHGLALTLPQDELSRLCDRLALLDAKSSALRAAMSAFRFDGTDEIAKICIELAEREPR